MQLGESESEILWLGVTAVELSTTAASGAHAAVACPAGSAGVVRIGLSCIVVSEKELPNFLANQV